MFMPFDPGLRDLQAFLRHQGDALQNAALLLGGQPALRRVQHLLGEMPGAMVLTARLKRELMALHDLLMLRHVHDPDRIEAALFADLDPASPITADLCLLADQLSDRLRALQGAFRAVDLAA